MNRPPAVARLPVLAAALLLLAGAPGCAAVGELFRDPADTVLPMIEPDRLYEELVGHYVELCAVSQYRPVDGQLGGIPGHAVMYLKGACRDEDAPYPRLRACRRATSDTSDAEHGAGVSVNRWFKNVNWVATPSRGLFFDGGLGRYDLLDAVHFERTVDRVMALEMFRGIAFHAKPGQEAPPDTRTFIAEESLGTDFALRFGRTVFCARLPMPAAMLAQVRDYLNHLNEQYWTGEADYNWSGYADNCVHALHNALAAAGVWEPKSVNATKLRQLFNLAVPANTFVDLAFLSNEYPIEDFGEIRGDPLRWRGLVEHGWLPARPGALVKTLPVHQVNTLYDTKVRMLVLAGWFRNDTAKRAQRLMTDGRYLQIDANLRYFYDRYQRILAGRDASGGLLAGLRGEDWERDRAVYYAHIEERRDAVLRAVERLMELDRLRDAILRDAYEEWKVRVRELED